MNAGDTAHTYIHDAFLADLRNANLTNRKPGVTPSGRRTVQPQARIHSRYRAEWR